MGIVGDWTCHLQDSHHIAYHIDFLAGPGTPLIVDPLLLVNAAITGVAFGLAGLVFAETNHMLGGFNKRLIPFGPLRPFVGGLAVIGLLYLLGTRDYSGLGVWTAHPGAPTISGFFTGPVDHWSRALKALFTIVTLKRVHGKRPGQIDRTRSIASALFE